MIQKEISFSIEIFYHYLALLMLRQKSYEFASMV